MREDNIPTFHQAEGIHSLHEQKLKRFFSTTKMNNVKNMFRKRYKAKQQKLVGMKQNRLFGYLNKQEHLISNLRKRYKGNNMDMKSSNPFLPTGNGQIVFLKGFGPIILRTFYDGSKRYN